MEETALIYVALVAALIPVLVGISQSRNASTDSYARSSSMFVRTGLLVAAGAGVSIPVDSVAPLLIALTLGMMLLATGLARQSRESEVFERFAEEQRVDITTGLPNERLFQERLAAEHSRTKRTNVRYSVAIFEIDGFALLSNEDQVNGLKLLAESLGESIRKTDSLGRIGERQVAVLLVDTLAKGAVIGCERACERFFFQSCGHSEHAHVTRPMTLSVGIAAFDEDTVDPTHVVDNAKLALRNLQNEMGTGIRCYERDEFARQAHNAPEPDASSGDSQPRLTNAA